MRLATAITIITSTLFFQQDCSVSAFSTSLPLDARSKTASLASTSTSTSTSLSLFKLRGEGRPKIKHIARDWTYVDDKGKVYQSEGNITVKVFLPEDGSKVKGCAFFMHGFSQFTKAYSDTLQRVSNVAGVAVISADTGITSIFGDIITNKSILCDVITNPVVGLQFVLQRKLSEDTKQCIQMILDESDEFKEFKIDKNVPMGVCGHSMGGGLSFPVAAAFPKINYVFTMAPVPGVSAFDPITKGVDVRTVSNSMLLAGSCDFIGRANKVKAISTASNEKKKKSSIFVEIAGGSHTGFEDELVLGNIGLDTILRLLGPSIAVENLILLIFRILSESTGQLEGSELLMKFFFQKMIKGQKVTVNDAQKYLDDSDMSRKNVEKFNITIG